MHCGRAIIEKVTLDKFELYNDIRVGNLLRNGRCILLKKEELMATIRWVNSFKLVRLTVFLPPLLSLRARSALSDVSFKLFIRFGS